jgi:glycosyltransferase involved in cell wall biosynthesis
MKKIDIIILSNTADDKYHNLLSITVNSIKSQTNIETNIILVETNKEYKSKEQYNLPIDVLVVPPDERFHFNKFLNYGLEHSTADYICFSNNDVRYFENCFYEIVEALQTFDSVSPYGIGYAGWNDFDENITTENYRINGGFLGWCYCFTRKTMNECFDGKFDERFAFYRQDMDVLTTLREKRFKHGVVGPAKAEHLNIKGNRGGGSNSYKLLGSAEDIHFYTEHPEQWRLFREKWNNK